MPPSDVSLKRSRKVPETVFFSSLRSWLRLTNPMMRLEQRQQLSGPPASRLPPPWAGRGRQLSALARPLQTVPLWPCHFALTTSTSRAGRGVRIQEAIPMENTL